MLPKIPKQRLTFYLGIVVLFLVVIVLWINFLPQQLVISKKSSNIFTKAFNEVEALTTSIKGLLNNFAQERAKDNLLRQKAKDDLTAALAENLQINNFQTYTSQDLNFSYPAVWTLKKDSAGQLMITGLPTSSSPVMFTLNFYTLPSKVNFTTWAKSKFFPMADSSKIQNLPLSLADEGTSTALILRQTLAEQEQQIIVVPLLTKVAVFQAAVLTKDWPKLEPIYQKI